MQERFIREDGITLWTCASGDGSPVCLISGGPGCCDYLAPVAELLEDAHTCIRFDARGCGRSSPADHYRLDQALGDLERIRRAYGFERWSLLGHSWGGDLALAYALRHPERCTRLACLAGGRVHTDARWREQYQIGQLAGNERSPDFAYVVNLAANRELNEDWAAWCRRPGLYRELASCRVPACFITCGHDIRPDWPTVQLAELLPRASHTRIAEADHYPWRTHAQDLGHLLARCLQSRAAHAAG